MGLFRHLPVLSLVDVASDLEQLEASGLAGPWTEFPLGAKIEPKAPPTQTIRVRIEEGRAVARLRGTMLVKPVEELKAGETAGTLPPGFRPPGTVEVEANEALFMLIAATGVITFSIALKAKEAFRLDTITFNLI